jgi:hypothetical protein
LDAKQQNDWEQKYKQLSSSSSPPLDRPASFAQFAWAMEVVHSRAFRGVDTNISNILVAIVAPLVAGALGYTYYSSTAFPSEFVFYGLSIMAVAPLLWNVLVQTNKSVVLLPLIDSANHLETAESSIVFNPLSGCFELSLQPSCIVPQRNADDDHPQQQVYINYGTKKDTELLPTMAFCLVLWIPVKKRTRRKYLETYSDVRLPRPSSLATNKLLMYSASL